MNNKQEFEFLNDTQETKENKNTFLKILDLFIILLSIFCNLFLICFESFCKLLELICWGDVAYTSYKTIKRHSKTKRWF